MQTILETDNLLLRYQPSSNRDLLVITFLPLVDDPGKHNDGFGERLLAPENIARIHITCRDNRWYQYPELPEIGPATAAIRAEYDQVALYGDSMGGYAALLAAAWLQPTRIVAAAPQFSANPSTIPFDPHWSAFGSAFEWLWEDISHARGIDTTVVYDNRHSDAHHAALIQQHTGARLIGLSYASHSVLGFLKETGVIRAMTLDLLRGRDCAAHLRHIRTQRADSAIYWVTLAGKSGSTRSKIACLRRAAELRPDFDLIRYRLAETEFAAGRFADAIENYDRFLQMKPDDGWVLHRKANACRKLGILEPALDCARRSAALLPHMAGVHLLLGDILTQTGKHAEADEALVHTTALEPEDSYFWYRRSQSYAASGKMVDALRMAIRAERLRPEDTGLRELTDYYLDTLH